MLPEEETVRLHHMLAACREAMGYARGRSRIDLDHDSMLLRAVVKCIEIIGEASSRVRDETKTAIPRVPWAAIRAMRNRLIHSYFDINHDIVWKTLTTDLPSLERELSDALDRLNRTG